MRSAVSRWLLMLSLSSVCVGCTCRDYMYLYHFNAQLIDATGSPAANARVRLQIRTEQPTFSRPEWVADWWYTDWLTSERSGELKYTTGGDKWGSCCGRTPPKPPAIANLLVSNQASPDQWIPIPATEIHQSCGELQCWVDIGPVVMQWLSMGRTNPATRRATDAGVMARRSASPPSPQL